MSIVKAMSILDDTIHFVTNYGLMINTKPNNTENDEEKKYDTSSFKLLPALSSYPNTKSNQFSIMSWNILIKELIKFH